MKKILCAFILTPSLGLALGGNTEQRTVPSSTQNQEDQRTRGVALTSELAQYRMRRSVSCSSPQSRAQCMICNCKNEAGNQNMEGKVAVNSSVLTRVHSGHFPNNICDVVWQRNGRTAMYSWTLMSKHTNVPVTQPDIQRCVDTSIEAVNKYLVEGPFALNYHNDQVNPRWARVCRSWGIRPVKIGNHYFYSNCHSRSGMRLQSPATVEQAISKIFNYDIKVPYKGKES